MSACSSGQLRRFTPRNGSGENKGLRRSSAEGAYQ